MGESYRDSDQILSEPRTTLVSYFDSFTPLFDEAAALVDRASYRGTVAPKSIYELHDGSSGIQFALLRADAHHLKDAVDAAEKARQDLGGYWAKLSRWQGGAATTAGARRRTVDRMADDFLQDARWAPGAIDTAMLGIENKLVAYAGDVVRTFRELRCAGMTPEDVRGAIEVVKGNFFAAKAVSFISKLYYVSGITWIAEWLGYGPTYAVEQFKQQATYHIRLRLQRFVEEFHGLGEFAVRLATNTHEWIAADYSIMRQKLEPLAKQAFTAPNDTTTPQTTGGGGRRTLAPRPPGGPTTTPQSTPTAPTTPMAPTAPTTMAPAPQQPVTIRHGNTTITVSPPDSQGTMKLTVSDGNGPPKTYDVNFTKPSAVTQTSGAVPQLPTQPVVAPQTQPQAPVLPPTLAPLTNKPAGTGDDRRAVIKDGDVTITLETDPDTDDLRITIDDGHGHRTTYTIDYDDPAHPTLRQEPEPAPRTPTDPRPLNPTPPFVPFPTVNSALFPGSVPVNPVMSPGGPPSEGMVTSATAGSGRISGQLDPGSFSGGQPNQGGTVMAGTAGGGRQPGGGQQPGGMPMMGGGMGAGQQQGGDTERAGNRFLHKQPLATGIDRERAIRAGGVIGEDSRKAKEA